MFSQRWRFLQERSERRDRRKGMGVDAAGPKQSDPVRQRGSLSLFARLRRYEVGESPAASRHANTCAITGIARIGGHLRRRYHVHDTAFGTKRDKLRLENLL